VKLGPLGGWGFEDWMGVMLHSREQCIWLGGFSTIDFQ